MPESVGSSAGRLDRLTQIIPAGMSIFAFVVRLSVGEGIREKQDEQNASLG